MNDRPTAEELERLRASLNGDERDRLLKDMLVAWAKSEAAMTKLVDAWIISRAAQALALVIGDLLSGGEKSHKAAAELRAMKSSKVVPGLCGVLADGSSEDALAALGVLQSFAPRGAIWDFRVLDGLVKAYCDGDPMVSRDALRVLWSLRPRSQVVDMVAAFERKDLAAGDRRNRVWAAIGKVLALGVPIPRSPDCDGEDPAVQIEMLNILYELHLDDPYVERALRTLLIRLASGGSCDVDDSVRVPPELKDQGHSWFLEEKPYVVLEFKSRGSLSKSTQPYLAKLTSQGKPCLTDLLGHTIEMAECDETPILTQWLNEGKEAWSSGDTGGRTLFIRVARVDAGQALSAGVEFQRLVRSSGGGQTLSYFHHSGGWPVLNTRGHDDSPG